MLLEDFNEQDVRPLTVVLHVMMTLNALLGLAEYASSTLVFPYRFDGAVHLEDPRSTSLQGHPLMNAALTAVYVVSLMTGAKTLKPGLRAVLIPLQFAALVVFGGRTAIVVSLALTPLIGVAAGFATLRRGRVSLLAVAALMAAIPLVAIVALVAVNAGLADKLLMRFVDDNGSADARVIMFDMLTAVQLAATAGRPRYRAGGIRAPPSRPRTGRREPVHPHDALPGRPRNGGGVRQSRLVLRAS